MSPSPRCGFQSVICDALKSTPSLTCLHLGCFKMNKVATCSALDAICRLLASELRELSLEALGLFEEACASLDAWGRALASTTCLKRLKIIDVGVTVQETGRGMPVDFVATTLLALTGTASISSLAVDASFAAHRCGASFKRMLANPSGPSELSVRSTSHEYRRKSNLAFEALVANNTVKKLSVENFSLGPMDAKALSKLLARSATIEDVSCATSHWLVRKNWKTKAKQKLRLHAQHLVEAISKTTSLRRLAIQYDFSGCEIEGVLLAARDCASLNELHFHFVQFQDVQPFHQAIVKTGAGPKLTVGFWSADDERMTSLAIRTWNELLTGGQHLYREEPLFAFNRYPRMWDLCRALAGDARDSLASLRICTGIEAVDARAAEVLAAYLPAARSLRMLDLRFPTSHSTAHAIIGGIIQSTSIEELTINNFSVDEDDVQLLCDWLCRSRRVHSLELDMDSKTQETALRTLISALQTSYSLTSFKSRCFFLHKSLRIQVLSLVRRNYSILHCAVRFVLGAKSKRAALAFELVSSYPQIVISVQRIGSLSQAETEHRIKESTRRLRDNFWQLAGIVHEELVCNDSDDTSDDSDWCRQFDELGEYVIARIRSFLKISDLLDEEDMGTPTVRDEEKRKPPSESFAPKDSKRTRMN
ncbi:uncharacterized protein LOC144130187 isoform X2 [Amblyomma americanum]